MWPQNIIVDIQFQDKIMWMWWQVPEYWHVDFVNVECVTFFFCVYFLKIEMLISGKFSFCHYFIRSYKLRPTNVVNSVTLMPHPSVYLIWNDCWCGFYSDWCETRSRLSPLLAALLWNMPLGRSKKTKVLCACREVCMEVNAEWTK
jgi:hypothetical protein